MRYSCSGTLRGQVRIPLQHGSAENKIRKKRKEHLRILNEGTFSPYAPSCAILNKTNALHFRYHMNIFHEFITAVANGTIVTHLGYISYILIFSLVIIEGPVVTLGAAALAGAGRLNPWGVFVAACAGNLTSDSLWYMIGYTGHLDFIRKRLPGFTRFDRQIRAVEKRLRKDGIKILIISKLSFGLMAIPVLIGAGISRVSWWRTLGAASICQIVWGGSLVLAGYYLGGSVVRHRLGLEAGIFFGGLFVFAVVMALYRYTVAPEK